MKVLYPREKQQRSASSPELAEFGLTLFIELRHFISNSHMASRSLTVLCGSSDSGKKNMKISHFATKPLFGRFVMRNRTTS